MIIAECSSVIVTSYDSKKMRLFEFVLNNILSSVAGEWFSAKKMITFVSNKTLDFLTY